jgi:hypothetical protein
MAETPADVRRDIEMTRNRISDTLTELEQKMNVTQIVKDNPWPSLALAVGAGVLLSGSGSDMKAAAATVTATRGASSRIGGGERPPRRDRVHTAVEITFENERYLVVPQAAILALVRE